MKREILILKGLPASGKSTYAKELAKKDNWKRWNNDEARLMFDAQQFNKKNEQFINLMRDNFIESCMASGYSVVVDNTNLHEKHQRDIQEIVTKFNEGISLIGAYDESYQYTVKTKFFDVPLDVCIERDSKRENPVGEKVIRDMYNQFLAQKPVQPFYKGDSKLPKAVIFDIDGTLAYNDGHRSFYDLNRVYDDKVNRHILDILLAYLGAKFNVILVSGREGTLQCREDTILWFRDKCGLDVEFGKHLFMRKAGDNRNDAIVKKELFYNYIHDKWNVEMVFDDRDRVVDMWRKEIGLPVSQVNYGNF